MAEYIIDIKTRFISDDQRTYIMFPGDGYRLYDDMLSNSIVFFDIPGFPITPDEDLDKADDLVERLVLAERIRGWHLAGRPSEDVPARAVAGLGAFRSTPARQQSAGQIRNFFTRVSVGDVVIVPPQNQDGFVLFGEVISTAPVSAAVSQYGTDLVPGLAVEWIQRVVRERIPTWLERKIGSPNPFRQVEKHYHPIVFDMMYERYFYDSQFVCKFEVSSNTFSSLDDYLFQQIILYVGALYGNSQDGALGESIHGSMSSVASMIDATKDVPELRININSPGHIVVYTKNLVPLIAGALMTLAAAAGSGLEVDAATIQIANSADQSSVSKECQADIAKEVVEDLNAMGYKRWQELCEIELRARRRTQISPGMGIVKPQGAHDIKPDKAQ